MDDLRIYVAADIVDRELAGIGGDLALEHHLQQHVTELFSHMIDVGRLDGVNGLIGLLDHVRRDRGMRLGFVPWTTVRGPEGRDRGNELVECRMVDRRGECCVITHASQYNGSGDGGLVVMPVFAQTDYACESMLTSTLSILESACIQGTVRITWVAVRPRRGIRPQETLSI